MKRLMLLAAALLAVGCNAPEAPAPSTPSAAPLVQTKGSPQAGQEAFQQTCSACHGQDAKGMPSLGKNLTTSKFVKSQTDDQLIAFVKKGRMPTDPGNTTHIAMPPKGGNPALTDAQLADIVAWIRTVNH